MKSDKKNIKNIRTLEVPKGKKLYLLLRWQEDMSPNATFMYSIYKVEIYEYQGCFVKYKVLKVVKRCKNYDEDTILYNWGHDDFSILEGSFVTATDETYYDQGDYLDAVGCFSSDKEAIEYFNNIAKLE